MLLFFCLICVMTSTTVAVVLTLLPLYDRMNGDGTLWRPKQEHAATAPTVRNRTRRDISTSIHTLRRRIDELDAQLTQDT